MFYNQTPGPYSFEGAGTYPITLFVAYGNGCVDTIIQSFTTGTTEYFRNDILYIIPNPAHDQIHIMAKQDVLFGNMYIYNLEGKMVGQVNAGPGTSSVVAVDVSDLSDGIYFIKYNNPQSAQNISFVVAH